MQNSEPKNTDFICELEEVEKGYRYPVPVRILCGIRLKIRKGDYVSISGPSGSGKTTLLHIMGTLLSPDSGRVRIMGNDPSGLDDRAVSRLRNQNIGFVFQSHNLLPEFTVLENVIMPLAIREKKIIPEMFETGLRLLERFGMETRSKCYPANLSFGERQRVAIIRSVIHQPDLILCDEPTGSLDHDNKLKVRKMLKELNEESGHTIVVATHDSTLTADTGINYNLRAGKLF